MVAHKEKDGRAGRGLEEALGLLGQGFLRGGLGSSLLKGPAVSQELRVGLSHTYVALGRSLGPAWLERQLGPVLGHLLELAGSPRAGGNHTEGAVWPSCWPS